MDNRHFIVFHWAQKMCRRIDVLRCVRKVAFNLNAFAHQHFRPIINL